MNPSEAAALLTVAAAFDNRKPDADAATAWSLALDGLRFEDCRDAIVGHYRTSTEWLMPAMVHTAVKRLRSARLMEHPPTNPPASLDPDDPEAYSRWLLSTRRAIADGRTLASEEYEATREIGDLRGVLKALPPAPVKPRVKSAEHEKRMAEVKAELATRGPVPMPEAEAMEAAE